jgi:DNA-binding transcriptional LysR family regulator
MAQPPLTRQIRAIEEELGTELFVRTPKGVELTAAGQTLLDEVPNILSLAERARERTQRAGQGLTGQLDVGIFGSGVLDVIPRLLAAFHQARPEVRIALHNQTKDEQLQALRERRITIGFNRLVPAEPGIGVQTVLKEALVGPAGHAQAVRARRGRTVRARQRAHDPLPQSLAWPGPGSQQCLPPRGPASERSPVGGRCADLRGFAAGGFGACITTRSATSLRLPGVEYRPLHSRHLRDIELSCLYRSDDASPVLAAFLDVVRTFAGQGKT